MWAFLVLGPSAILASSIKIIIHNLQALQISWFTFNLISSFIYDNIRSISYKRIYQSITLEMFVNVCLSIYVLQQQMELANSLHLEAK